MTGKEAFITGLLGGLVETGKTMPQIRALIKEAANQVREKRGDPISTLFNTAVKEVAVPGAALGLAAPWIAGAAGGHLLGRATDISTSDVKNVRDEELLQSLQHETQNLQRIKALRDYHQARRRIARPY